MQVERPAERSLSGVLSGEHICCFPAEDGANRGILSRYLDGALARGARALYLYGDGEHPDDLLAALSVEGLSARQAVDRGALILLPASSIFGSPETFQPTAALHAVRDAARQARAAGFSGLRAAACMDWAASICPGSPEAARLMAFEARLGLPGALDGAAMVCLYDRRRCNPRLLLDLLAVHPALVSVGNGPERVVQNNASAPVDLWLAPNPDTALLEHALEAAERPPETEAALESAWAALRETEDRYRTIFDAATEAIFITDTDGRFLDVNRVACERLGWAKEDLIGGAQELLECPELAGQVPVRLQLLRQYGSISYETVQITHSGDLIPVEVNARLIHYAGGPAVLSIARDITDRKRGEMAVVNANNALSIANEALEDANLALEQANAALHASEQKFRSLVEQSPDGIALADEQGRVIEFNPAAERMFGVSAGQMLGLDMVSIFFDHLPASDDSPRKRAEAQHTIAIALRTGEGSWFYRPCEFHLDPRPGQEGQRAIQTIGFPIHTERGAMIGVIARDVTAQRSAEKELDRYRCQLETMVAERTIQLQHEIGERQEVEKNLEVMLREIHHRVKNNLNVMIALIDLQKGAQTDPHTLEVFKDLQTRAYTMALVHESLYRSPNLASVDFSAYLQTLVAYLHSAYRPAWRSVEADGDAHGANVRIVVEAHPASLVIETAIPCGLIVNELVTNALKYAFPPDRQGPDPEVRVGLEPVGPYRPGPWRLTIADNGVGMPPGLDWRSAGTLGLQLVRVLARQLGGTLTLAEDAGGLCWVLAFDERKAHEPRE